MKWASNRGEMVSIHWLYESNNYMYSQFNFQPTPFYKTCMTEPVPLDH